MLRIVICEDEISQQDLLKGYIERCLSEYTSQYEVLVFNSGEELLESNTDNVDIFLLDIQMDEISGMDVARRIRESGNSDSEIIFITSVVEYIQQGYEVRAYRYLLKPIKFEDINNHLVACIESIRKSKENYLIIDSKSNVDKIRVSDITYVEIQKKDMVIHTVENSYDARMSMDKIEKELIKYGFYRIHKSFLVNINYVEKIKQYVAILENGEEVPISRHRFKEFKSVFLDYLGDILC